jgi:hypothetical protein
MRSRDRVRTLRGTYEFPARAAADPPNTGRRLLILDDGRINIGYRIIDFRIWNADSTGEYDAYSTQAHLSMSLDITSALDDASDNREIAWAAYNTGTGFGIDQFHLVDPNHIVVRDLNLLFTQVANSNVARVNYYILMEEYDITDQEAIISIIKEESQDVDN